MDERCFELASRHVGEGYVRQATEAMSGLNTKMRLLLEQAGGIPLKVICFSLLFSSMKPN